MSTPMPAKQRGATLFIALIVLLVITLLALSGAQETSLESRITGNFVAYQQQLGYAEAALREGEQQLTSVLSPVEQNDCSSTYCFRGLTAVYGQDFSTSLSYPLSDDANQQIHWYALPATSGAAQGQSENPEYGSLQGGRATYRYEVNAQSTQTANGQTIRLRSTTVKIFN